jgi:hypothetical protein
MTQVMAKLTSEATGIKAALVPALLSASYAFIAARRVLTGTALQHAVAPPSLPQRLVAAATVAVLGPVYALAQRVLWSKVRVWLACCGAVDAACAGVVLRGGGPPRRGTSAERAPCAAPSPPAKPPPRHNRHNPPQPPGARRAWRQAHRGERRRQPGGAPGPLF